MKKSNNILLLVIIVIFAFTLWVVLPGTSLFGREDLRLGLDLKGGVQLVYQAKFSDNATASERNALMRTTILKIEQRIDKFGVTEPVISQVGENRILIQLPGFTDSEAAKSLVQQTGFLEFRVVEKNASGTVVTLKDYLDQSSYAYINTAEQSNRLFTLDVSDSQGNQIDNTVAILGAGADGALVMTDGNGNPIEKETLTQFQNAYSWIPARSSEGEQLTGSYLSDAQYVLDTSGGAAMPAVSIKWNSEGSDIFDQIAAVIHNPAGSGGSYAIQYAIGIFLDNNLLSRPQVLQASYGGTGQISGKNN